MSKKFVLSFTFLTILLCAFIYCDKHFENTKNIEQNASTYVRISVVSKHDISNDVVPGRIFACLSSLLFIPLLVQIIAHAKKIYLWKVELPVFWGAKYRIQSPRCKITNKCSVFA